MAQKESNWLEKNAARTLRRKLPKTAWPSLYWTQIPIECPKIRKRIWIEHPFQLPHEWLAVYMADPRVWARSQPAEGSTVANALKICLRLATDQPMNGWLNDLHMALGFHGDGAPVQGTMRQESLYFLTMNMPGCKTHAALFFKASFITNMKQREKFWRCSCGLCNA